MNIVRMEAFTVMGREVRTSNARELSGQGSIGQLWSKMNPELGKPVAVYSQYASNKDGEYSYMLGVEIGHDETLPLQFSRRDSEEGDYVCLKSEGPVTPELVVGLWRQIWALEEAGELSRAYRTDFEIYRGNGVELYVGVKS
ncbi:MAG TPA: effector binding domain-containing protein [Bryobacteraceae bacterium]|nr:effector binding domain-containing protein [Bryobacteraceae bacterium]